MLEISSSSIIEAPPAVVYAILVDYHDKHPAILPDEFTGLSVLEGGQGAGTKIKVDMSVMGTHRVFEMVVTEPEPGRVLVETDIHTGQKTTFTVVAHGDNHTRLTITSEAPLSKGVTGFFERLFNPIIIRRIFNKQLSIINGYAMKMAQS